MLPERPNTDAGDKNCQVKKNFSPTPGLTPVYNFPHLSTAIIRIHREHDLPYLQHAGMNLAGSKDWTSIEERPHTLLLVIELAEVDRYRWRDLDANLRKLLRNNAIEHMCYLRYYLERPKTRAGEHPEEAYRRPQTPVPAEPERRRDPLTPDSLPELIAMEPEPRPRVPIPTPHSDRRAAFRRLAASSATRERVLRPRNDSTDEETRRPEEPWPEPCPEVRTTPPLPTRSERLRSALSPRPAPPPRTLPEPDRRGNIVWAPTESDLLRMSVTTTMDEVARSVDTGASRRNPAPALPPGLPLARPLPEHYRPRGRYGHTYSTTNVQVRNTTSGLAGMLLEDEGDDEYGWPY